MLNLNDLAKQAHTLAKERKLPVDVFHTLKHCAGEVVEATEAYTRAECADTMCGHDLNKQAFALELADIIICALTASVEEDIDIERAINEAMIKNARRAYGRADSK